jgi:hypothetical protein
LYCSGLIVQGSAIAIFILFFLQQWYANIGAKFISLEPNAGLCNQVSLQVSGLYTASSDGYWQGSSGFVPFNSMYTFELQNMDANYYETYMTGISRELELLGREAYYHTLPVNLLYWLVAKMTDETCLIAFYRVEYEHSSDTGGELQQFYFTGYPNVLFDTTFMSIDIQSAGYYCNVPRVLTFDPATAMNKVSFGAVPYLESANCTESLNPYLFGYSDEFPESQFNVNVDMNAFTTAVSINSNLRRFAYLLKAESFNIYYTFEGASYTIEFKVRDVFVIVRFL